MQVIDGTITSPQGFLAQGVCAEIKYKDKKDVAIIYSEVECNAAAVYTTNQVHAACIDLCRAHLQDGRVQAVVVNSGNANACTGRQGMEDSKAMANLTAAHLGIKGDKVLVASTGVIGVSMPMDKIMAGIEMASAGLSADGGRDAALAIMTTDLVPKEAAVELKIGGHQIRVAGMAKGSGMIHPNMATMLAFITTDAHVCSHSLQKMLKSAVDRSFNMISVDRDTSTNDMALIMANGVAGNKVIYKEETEEYQKLQQAINLVCTELAKKIARDGEGANRMIEVQVENAADDETARVIARSITGSNLTKAAVFGEDANWGRILAAAGYSGADFDPNTVDIFLGSLQVARDGMGLAFDEEQGRRKLQQDPVVIRLDMKSGTASATAWGCDLSYEYVRINAAYRT